MARLAISRKTKRTYENSLLHVQSGRYNTPVEVSNTKKKNVFYPKRLPIRRSLANCLRLASPCADGNGQPLHSALLPLATIVMLFLPLACPLKIIDKKYK